jgi:hypothetical protein
MKQLILILTIITIVSCKKQQTITPNQQSTTPICDSTECLGLSANDFFTFKTNINTDTILTGKKIRATWTGVSDTTTFTNGVVEIKHEYHITSNHINLTNVISPIGLKFWAKRGGAHQGIELKFKSGKKASFYNDRLP